ncbi:glycosyltransferase family 2 protein [Ramlibacter humi]|uniref:Glycosyltransferase family 2 protein n=1 Tax=Ramlibacter humi TaxID=2530451 RepID=A0A4Z0CCH7_9BURK|nr:glycosyltransferase family 2 protein [Ramlibacter humi]TFZ08168.1 glycosyltransferase family 2 protein [Ramlibacter humi]
MKSLSVILITRNEARNIEACLESVSFAAEAVVVDSGSSDGTAALAQARGARVVVTQDWPGFGPQKNRALELATGEWVLSIDADERVTPELRESILAAIAQPRFDAYEIDRRSSYCGQSMAHSGWSPDRVVRLVRRGTASFSPSQVHERLVPAGPVGRLEGKLLHESMRDFESVIDKMDRYSTAGARMLMERGVRGSMGKSIAHGLWAFLRTYVFRLGFLDGRLGFALAVSNAEGTYYRYMKLWLMQRQAAGNEAGPG